WLFFIAHRKANIRILPLCQNGFFVQYPQQHFWFTGVLSATYEHLPAAAFHEYTPYGNSHEDNNSARNSTRRRAFSIAYKNPHGIEHRFHHRDKRAFHCVNPFESVRKNSVGDANLHDTEICAHQKIGREYRRNLYESWKADKPNQDIPPED